MVEGRDGLVGTDTSCPRCGAGARAGTSTCRRCGFEFLEARPRRSLPRPSPRWIVASLLVVAAVATTVGLVSRDSPPEAPAPVPPAGAETRLMTQLRAGGVDDAGSVRCRGSIRRGRLTRCELVYADGDTQLLLVDLTADGELDIQQPYPAQRRPAGG